MFFFSQFVDIRVAVIGNVDAGKSTLLGVLTHGEFDNGRGRARLNLFRHLHEIQSGRTSSISHEILGFDNHGEVACLIHSFIPKNGLLHLNSPRPLDRYEFPIDSFIGYHQ